MIETALSPPLSLDALAPLAALAQLARDDTLPLPALHARLVAAGFACSEDEVAALVHDLAAAGLVEPVPGDAARVRLTAAGREQFEAARHRAVDILGLPDPDSLAEAHERLERLRTDLLSTVSHELRTPLTLIRTSAGLLLESQPDATMRVRLLRNIKQSADRMSALVADLLDLVRLRQSRAELELRSVDLGTIVRAATTLIRPLLDEKRQQMTVEVPDPAPVVTGDARRLERAVLNLLSNANIYAQPGAAVRVSVRDDGDWATISVADTGPGIPPDAMGQLFEQFYTARTSSSSHNIGVGLGLPIVKGTIEAHGGRVEVESDLGAGSTFHLILPVERSQDSP